MKRKINIDEAMMSSLGLVSEYENVDTAKIDKVASQLKETALEKVAGIFINNPTQENIEDFLRKYMYNELTFFPRILEVLVDFIPSTFSKSHPDYVSDGTGVIGIKVRHKIVELPFLVRDGELDPFDVIQMDGQRAPYSRDNLQRIISNLDRQIQQEEDQVSSGGENSPYKGLDDYNNPTTTPGFMGDVLAIRDSQSMRTGAGMYVTAGNYEYGFEKEAKQAYNVFPFGEENRDSLEHQFEKAVAKVEAEKPTTKAPKGTEEKAIKEEKLASKEEKKAEIVTDLNALLEKTASIAPMADEELETIAYVLSKKAHDEFVSKLEKMANEESEPTRREMEIIEKKASFKFTDASSIGHGEFIVFPEINGNEVSLTPAIVLANLDSSMMKKKGNSYKFVCAIDGRIKVLEGGEKFLCSKAPDKQFKLPTTGLGALNKGDVFFAVKGNNVISPSEITNIVNPRIGDMVRPEEKAYDVCKIYECKSIDTSDSKKDVFFSNASSDNEWRKGKFSIATMDNKRFEIMKFHDFLEAKAKETCLSQEAISAVMPRWSLELGNDRSVFVSDMQSPVIKVKGAITTHFKSQNEYDTKSRLHEAGYDVEKVAFTVNMITVYCVDRKQDMFNMTVDYKDTEERFMNLRKQIFNRISKGKLKAILRILKFEGSVITEIIFKAKNEQKAQYPIPASCTMENIREIQGGDMHNISKESVKGAVNKYINPLNIAKGLAMATASGLVTDGLGQIVKNNPSVASKMTGIAKFFSESTELSGAFEKAAQEYENEDFLDYARVLALSGHFAEKIATALNDNNNVYPSIKDVSHEIVMAKPVLEKFAYDLTSLKVNQSIQRHELIPNNIIRGAIENMDSLYKMAYSLDIAINKDELIFK